MKKIIAIAALALGIAVSAAAQPKAIGGRLGYQTEVSYLHTLGAPNFIEVNAGVDFNSIVNGHFGFTASALYNFVFAQPNWTSRGDWEWYAGPGITTGWVGDHVVYKEKVGDSVVKAHDYRQGFMLGLAAQVGLSYTFWFPLQLSVDLRPVLGMHINNGYDDGLGNKHGSKLGFYDNGFTWNWLPTLSVRYAF